MCVECASGCILEKGFKSDIDVTFETAGFKSDMDVTFETARLAGEVGGSLSWGASVLEQPTAGTHAFGRFQLSDSEVLRQER